VDTRISPFLEIQLSWAQHHCWPPQQHLQQTTVASALWLVLDGNVQTSFAQQQWSVSPGEVFLTPAGVLRDISTPTGGEWLSLGLRATLFGRVDVSHLLQAPRQWSLIPPERTLWEPALRQIIALQDNDDEAALLIRQGLTRAIWGLCWQQTEKTTPVLSHVAPEQMPLWLSRALQQMQEQPGLAITELAHEAGWSPAQFRRHFHHWVGLSPRDYLRQQRLQLARQWLENTDWPIADIALRLGFQDASQFGRVFKAATNATPQAYRRLSRQRETPL
jgi:AraC-like DNA-binding protein